MAKRRKHMPRGKGWRLSYNGKTMTAALIKKIRVSDLASIVIFRAHTPKIKRG
jgi:hypothetical protein